VRVESAIRQSCLGHNPGHSRRGDTLPPELLGCGLQDAFMRVIFVPLGLPHTGFSKRISYCMTIIM
jgi:hypothetical protein